MVRMGEDMPTRAKDYLSKAVEASEALADQLASKFRVEVDADDVSEVAGKVAEQMRREAFRAANGAKFERELDEKYGVFKDVILHPTVQWFFGLCVQLWRSFRLFGNPPLGTTAGVIVCLMIYRRKVGFVNMSLAAAVLSGLNPLVVVFVVLLWKAWTSTKLLPRGCKVTPEYGPTEEDVDVADKLSDDYTPEKVSGGDEEYDNIVVGSDLGGLFCAALLSRCGRRVLVLEQGPLVGAGAVVKAPEGAGEWEFETGVQCLGGGSKLARFVQRLQLACLPGVAPTQWDQVGALDSKLRVHDMASIGGGPNAVVFPAKQEKLVETFTEQFPERRTFFKAFFAQSAKGQTGAMVYYLSKLFPVRSPRWLDRVLMAMFVAPAAAAHVEIAKRSVKDVLAAMMKAQPEANDDAEAAQAALCALFRSENLPPQRVSYAALMSQMADSWGGMFHPRGGFRVLAENLVDTIRASGGRVLTRARAVSVLVSEGRAAGVCVTRENSTSTATSTSTKNDAGVVSVRVAAADSVEGSVISSVGVVHTFRTLVPSAESLAESGAVAGAEGPAAVAAAGAAVTAALTAGVMAGGEAEKKGPKKEGLEPAGFSNLREARPRVHLCVGLQGNWLEDLDGTSAFFHHVRNSMIDGGGGGRPERGNGGGNDRYAVNAERDWYRISFLESKDSTCWSKGTTTCVVTAEMGDDMTDMVIVNAGSTRSPIGPLHYKIRSGKAARDRTQERLLRRLHQEFPLTEGRDEFVMLAEEPRVGLSHGPERYVSEGVRAPTKLPGLFLAGQDLTIGGMEGSVMGGWIAAHAALGYTPADMFLRQRSLSSDIPNLDKLQGR